MRYRFVNCYNELTPSINKSVCCRSVYRAMLLLPAEATAVLFSASSKVCQHDNSWTAALNVIKFCTLTTSRTLLNIKVKGQAHMAFCVFLHSLYWMNQFAWIHEMLFTRWRHYITAHGSDCRYPRAVLSLEQGLTVLFMFTTMPLGHLPRYAGDK